MKWSPILHGITAISAVIGTLALLGWWIALATSEGFSFSLMFSPEHIYDDAIALLLVSIAFGIGTLIHKQEEKDKE